MEDTYIIVKDLKPEIKVSKYFAAYDLFAALAGAVVGLMLQGMVASAFRIPFIVFCILVSIFFRLPSPFNRKKRMFSSFLFSFKRNKSSYIPEILSAEKKTVVKGDNQMIPTLEELRFDHYFS